MDANKVLAVARGELGNTESPAGSNRTKYGKWFGLDGYAWCMMFVMWVFAQVGALKLLPKRTASCGDLMRAAKAAGCWVTKDYRPGDVVIYDFPGGAATDHTGIIEKVTLTGVVAIEGNTSQSGSQSNGGMVCRKNRPSKYIIGAVRPQLEQEEKEDIMTGKEIYDALQDYLKTQSVPKDTQKEVDEALELDITDGKNLMQLPNRYQILLMIKRAMEK